MSYQFWSKICTGKFGSPVLFTLGFAFYILLNFVFKDYYLPLRLKSMLQVLKVLFIKEFCDGSLIAVLMEKTLLI